MTSPFPDEFIPVCRYWARDGKAELIEWLNHDLLKKRGTVYARVVEGSLVYVGSAQGTLWNRLRVHSRGTRNELGRDYWKHVDGKQVTIIAYKPDPIEILGRSVEVYRGLEATLINEFKPKPPGPKPWFVARI